jgi:hypothetical protein
MNKIYAPGEYKLTLEKQKKGECSECLHTQETTGIKNYCAVCGVDMRGEQDG